jgi:glucose/arabinose dehydrogenase
MPEPPAKTRRVLLAVLALAFALAAGCGSDEPSGEAPDAGTGPSGETSADAPETSPETAAEPTEPTEPAEASQTTLAEAPERTDDEPEAAPEAEEAGGPVEVETAVVATGLEAPWGLDFLPDGRALVTERDSARVLAVDGEGNTEELATLPAGGTGEGGLLGVALSPNYEVDRYVYAYYTTAGDNRVVRFRVGEEPEPVFTGIPVNSYHNGGRIAFGPDGKLYVGTGDAGDVSLSQDPGSVAGKILRLELDGSVPEDNPFTGSPVYSYGHRNVQGLAWDGEGRLFATEFGQDTFDEVNLIEPGENYGWPEVEGEGGEPEYADPISVFDTAEASPSGAAILKGGAIPQWEGDFFMAGLRGERLWRLELNPDGTLAGREELLVGEAGRLRHVAQAPDGSLWVLTSNRDGRGNPSPQDDRILRLGPAAS